MLGDVLRSIQEPLTQKEGLLLAKTLAGSGTPAAMLSWLTGYLATTPEHPRKSFRCYVWR